MIHSSSIDLELMRAAQGLDSDPAEAARRAGAILASAPLHVEASLLLATACARLGDASVAIRVLEPLVALQPESALLQLELGRAYAAAGHGTAAMAAFSRAVEIDAALSDAWAALARERYAAGDEAGGDSAYARYSKLSRLAPGLNDAALALADNRLMTAESLLSAYRIAAPNDVDALRMQAECATRRLEYAQAERLLSECLALAPGYAEARYDLACALLMQQKGAAALPLVERLLAGDPGNASYQQLKAQVLRLLDRTRDAIELVESTLKEHPADANSWLLYGTLLREAGDTAQAINAFRKAKDLRPESGRAYWSLANLKTYRFTLAEISELERTVAGMPAHGIERIHFEFALGKAREDAQEFARAFEHYALGNHLFRLTIEHDADAVAERAHRSSKLYTREFFSARSGSGSSRRDPIFIVGLPRSGSTLLEQILASHSQIEGAGELTALPSLALELGGDPSLPSSTDYLQSVARLGGPQLEELAREYLAKAAVYRREAKPRFVDKMLLNFQHVGLIHLMFPNASIIDARRHPVACGFSCYKQLFSRGIYFSYDQEEMGRYYRDYAQVMEHFDAVLPGRIYRLHYENLIADPEREVRQLLEHCELPFEASCLRFHENRRTVQTISSEQVRQPLYTESVDQWRHFEQWLGPLKAALGDLVDAYPGRTA